MKPKSFSGSTARADLDRGSSDTSALPGSATSPLPRARSRHTRRPQVPSARGWELGGPGHFPATAASPLRLWCHVEPKGTAGTQGQPSLGLSPRSRVPRPDTAASGSATPLARPRHLRPALTARVHPERHRAVRLHQVRPLEAVLVLEAPMRRSSRALRGLRAGDRRAAEGE